jgi:hypothetical protein
MSYIVIPSQSGNSGKYLTTNGTKLSWGTVTGGGSLAKTFEYNVSATPVNKGRFTVVDGDITTSSIVNIEQAFSALTGKGTRADENEMDTLICNAEVGTGSMVVYWQVAPMLTIRKIAFEGNTTARPSLTYPLNDIGLFTEVVRLGKVKGNFKFKYIIH